MVIRVMNGRRTRVVAVVVALAVNVAACSGAEATHDPCPFQAESAVSPAEMEEVLIAIDPG